jgi:hypothetical protein
LLITICVDAPERCERRDAPSADGAGGFGRRGPLVVLDLEHTISKSDVGGRRLSTP